MSLCIERSVELTGLFSCVSKKEYKPAIAMRQIKKSDSFVEQRFREISLDSIKRNAKNLRESYCLHLPDCYQHPSKSLQITLCISFQTVVPTVSHKVDLSSGDSVAKRYQAFIFVHNSLGSNATSNSLCFMIVLCKESELAESACHYNIHKVFSRFKSSGRCTNLISRCPNKHVALP